MGDGQHLTNYSSGGSNKLRELDTMVSAALTAARPIPTNKDLKCLVRSVPWETSLEVIIIRPTFPKN